MTNRVFVKHYDDPHRCAAAGRHLAWLLHLGAGVRLPALREASTDTLEFEHLDGTRPGPEHLGEIADALGRLHVAAYQRQLHAARLELPFYTGDLAIADFVQSRREVLRQVPTDVAGLPAALYKDANVRNFVLTRDGVAIVDFDTLTLAPFGYDLAKLVVSTVMTYGAIAESAIAAALEVYNARVGHLHELSRCSRSQFDTYERIHELLTRPYLHRNGYHFTWPDGRPARDPRRPPAELPRAPAATSHGSIVLFRSSNSEVRQ